jgi:hypothetical protein
MFLPFDSKRDKGSQRKKAPKTFVTLRGQDFHTRYWKTKIENLDKNGRDFMPI